MNDKIIDHIFITPAFKVLSWGILTDTYYGRFPSDHFPMLSDCEVLTGYRGRARSLYHCAYKLFTMASFNLKPGTDWDEVKERIKERNVYLTDDDLRLEPGKEDALLKRLAEKMERSS